MPSNPTTRNATPSSRSTTEEALLDALETVLQRDGLRQLSVNAVVEAAGVGKPLLYRYFGDLQGLVQAWGKRRGFWAEVGETGPASRQKPYDQSFRQQIADELVASVIEAARRQLDIRQ